MAKPKKNPPKPPGPAPDRLIIEGDWQAAVRKAMAAKRPPGGWPKPEKTTAKKPAKTARKRSAK